MQSPIAAVHRRLLLAGAIAVGAAACHPPGERVNLRIGYQKAGVLLLAKARGGLEAALARVGRVQLTWVEFAAGPQMLEAMRAGAIDIGAVGDTPPIFAQSAGAPIVYIAAVPDADAAEAIIVPASSPLQRLADIKGAKVGLTRGSSSHLLLIEALKSVALTMSDIKPTYLAPPDAASAFANGAIDAWAIWDPYLALAQHRSATRTLVSRGELPHSSSFILAYRPFVERSPRVVAAVLDFLARVSDWGNTHLDEAAHIISSDTGIPEDVTRIALSRAPLAIEPLNAAIIARQQAAADVFHAQGFIPAPVVIKDMIWTRDLAKATAAL